MVTHGDQDGGKVVWLEVTLLALVEEKISDDESFQTGSKKWWLLMQKSVNRVKFRVVSGALRGQYEF